MARTTLDQAIKPVCWPCSGGCLWRWMNPFAIQPASPDWRGWRVHKPAIEGDPRPLLQRLQAGAAKEMVSTVFETGIGARAVAHLAALAPVASPVPQGWLQAGGPRVSWIAISRSSVGAAAP